MTRRPFLLGVCGVIVGVAATVSCLACRPQPAPPTDPEPARIWSLSPRSLYESYLDGARRWEGQSLSINLSPGSYTIVPGAIHWHAGRTTDPPDLVFEANHLLPDNKARLDIVAVCSGKVFDGKLRTAGQRYYVHLKVTQLKS